MISATKIITIPTVNKNELIRKKFISRNSLFTSKTNDASAK
jgi:hypothetical protein